MHSPMEQFEIKRLLTFHIGSIDASYTNSALWMTIAVALAFVVFVDVDLGTLLGEVEERIRVDAADHGDNPITNAPLDSRGCRTGNVEPAAQGDEEDRIAQGCDVVPTRGEYIARLHGVDSTSDIAVTHPVRRRRNRCISSIGARHRDRWRETCRCATDCGQVCGTNRCRRFRSHAGPR